MRRSFSLLAPTVTLVVCLLLAGLPAAHAKMSSKEWKETETLFKELFSQHGNPKGKAAVLEKVASDGTGRAWRTIAEGLKREVELYGELQTQYAEASKKHSEVLKTQGDGSTAEEENAMADVLEVLKELEEKIKAEREAMGAVMKFVMEGPLALRTNILQRAKSGGDWPIRAAAVQIAAATPDDRKAVQYFRKGLTADPDPRVRMSALATLGEGADDLLIGRLADSDWGVALQAARMIKARKITKAVPHLINALPRATPRVAEVLGNVLCELTGENFEPYADIWGKWWKDNKDTFGGKVAVKSGKKKEFAVVHFYGVPIKSDRVLFIIDRSSSMKLETQNKNPAEEWKPPPVTTGGAKAPPPPPPPPEVLSGPKILVAKHELKKAIEAFPEDGVFGIISFGTGVKAWRDGKMEKASKKNKQDALKWVRQLDARGSTYIDGALRMAFNIAGLINYDPKYPEIHVDTMVLLSDGAPTDNTGGGGKSKLMDPEIILQHVREWNKDKRVVINTVSVDMIKGIEFMKKLSAENGGVHVDR